VAADFSTLKMEAIPSSETLVHARCTQRHVPEDDILHDTKPLGSMEGAVVLNDLSDYQFSEEGLGTLELVVVKSIWTVS
jgi:hypothetical protein